MYFNKKKVLFITAGVITLVLLAGSLALLLNINKFKPTIETAVSSALEMDFRIKGGMRISFLPEFGILLKDVRLQKRGSDVVTIEKMTIGLKLLPLAMSQIRITHVGIIKPVLSIVRDKNGMFNFETQGDSSLKMLLSVKKFSVSHGKLIFNDETFTGKIEASDFDLNIKNFLYDGVTSSAPLRNLSFTVDARVRKFRIYEFTGKIPRKAMEGLINLSAELTAMGKNADELKRSLNGNVSLNGEDLMFYNMDIDALIMKYEKSQNFNLVDMGAFVLAGPFGPVFTKSFNFVRLFEESQGGKGVIKKLVSVWEIKNGIAEALDVAFASKKQRVAMKGRLNFINEQFIDVTVAAIDKRGCAVYSEKIHGPFSKPRIEKTNIFKSIAGAVINPLKDTWEFLQGKECTVFYSGSVAQPEG